MQPGPMQPGPPPQQFGAARLDRNTALLLCAIGFFGFCGIHRFYVKEVGMGVAMLLTGGFCFVGQVIDLIRLATMSDQDFHARYNR